VSSLHRGKQSVCCSVSVVSFVIKSYIVSQKNVHPFYFCDYSVKCWPILIIFGNIAAEKICKQMTFLSYIIPIIYEYYTMEKNCVLTVLPLCFAIVPVSCSFFKSFFSLHSLQPLFRNSLISFLLHNLWRRTNFHENLIVVAETNVYIKP